MRIFAVGTKILGGGWPTFGGPVPPGPNVEPPLDLPQTLHGDRARRAHHERCHPFFDPTYSSSYRVHGKIRPNLPMRGFSAMTP